MRTASHARSCALRACRYQRGNWPGLLETRATQQQGFVDDLRDAAVLLRAGRLPRPTLGDWLDPESGTAVATTEALTTTMIGAGMTDDDVLIELPGYLGWTSQLQEQAVKVAASSGVLAATYEFAKTRYFEGAQSSSNSSVTFLVADAPMAIRSDPAFVQILQEEFSTVLAGR
jgi:hypothetical protein